MPSVVEDAISEGLSSDQSGGRKNTLAKIIILLLS